MTRFLGCPPTVNVGRENLLRRVPVPSVAVPGHVHEGPEQVGELHWEDKLRGLAGAKLLERVEVLEAQGVGVDGLGHLVNLV